VGGVELKVESGDLYGFLFVASEAGEAIGEGVGYSEFHGEVQEL
jgi:hypothetical protein